MSLIRLETTYLKQREFNSSKFIELATKMKEEGKIKTDLEFAKQFMFAFDDRTEKFCLNLESLVEYKVYDRKDHAKRALKRNFIEGADFNRKISCSPTEGSKIAMMEYEVKTNSTNDSDNEPENNLSHGGNNKEIIMMTTDCFKLMCIMAGSDAGRTVRQYYLDLEHVSKMYIRNEFLETERLLLESEQSRAESEKLRIRAEKLHQQNIQKHRYFKFGKKGPTFYAGVSGLDYADGSIRIKPGVVGCEIAKPKKCKKCGHKTCVKRSQETLDSRLATHRTLWPQLQLIFVVYTPNAQLLENAIKLSYKNKINPNGHEMIENVDPKDFVETVNNYLRLFDISEAEPSYKIEENLDLYNKQALMPIWKNEENEEKLELPKNNEESEHEEDETNEDEVKDQDVKESEESEKSDEKSPVPIIQNISIINNFGPVTQATNEPSLEEALSLFNNLKNMTCAQLKSHLEKFNRSIGKTKDKQQDNLRTYLIEVLNKHGKWPLPSVSAKPTKKAPIMDGYRVCAVCNEKLHITDFWPKTNGINGRDNTCASCRNEVRRREWNRRKEARNVMV